MARIGSELVSAALAVALLRASNLPVTPATYALAAFGSALTYALDHALDKQASRRRHHLGLGIALLWFSGLAFSFAVAEDHSRIVAAAYGILASTYLLPLFPGRCRLQDFPLARSAAILGGWTCVPLLSPSFALLPPAWYPSCICWLFASHAWSDWYDCPRDHATRPTLLGELPLARIFLLTRIALIAASLGFFCGGLRILALAPLGFLLAQEIHPRRRIRTFARFADLPLLIPLLLFLADLAPFQL